MIASSNIRRPLVVLNPGHQSRHYMLGILRACKALGLNPGSIETGPIHDQLARASDASRAFKPIIARLRTMIEAGSFTDIISYANAGGLEFGCWNTPEGPGTIWTALGLDHRILWTDHPEWAGEGAALTPEAREIYKHPGICHFLKSEPAADEARAILGWAHVFANPVAEDYESLVPAPAISPIHDAVVIAGSLANIPEELEPFLDDEDPNPAVLDRALIPRTLQSWAILTSDSPDPQALRQFASEVLEARAAHPSTTIWQHAVDLRPSHEQAMAWLTADPQRWYQAQARLRQSSAWRRSFWLCWLSRRVDLGVYGCNAHHLGIDQPDGAQDWVGYEDQSRVYSLGRCAININQSHDESGVTHKPFQMVASGVPMIHHAVQGLNDLFTPGREVLVFARGPELLHRIDALCSDPSLRQAQARCALARARRDHAWSNRVSVMLGLNRSAASLAA